MMKCQEKVKVNSRYKRKYDKPKTPYQRVLNCSEIEDQKKLKLKGLHDSLDPFTLKQRIEKHLRKIFKHVDLNEKPRVKI